MAPNPHLNFRRLGEVGDRWGTIPNEAGNPFARPASFVEEADRKELLAWGVGHEGEGRVAYLRTSYARLPQQRDVMPATTMQLYGFFLPVGNPMKLYPGKQEISGTKHFFQRTSLYGFPRRPDTGRLRDDAVMHED